MKDYQWQNQWKFEVLFEFKILYTPNFKTVENEKIEQ